MFASTSRAIRSLGGGERVLYLTFDDGPDERTTPAVLELLERYKARATFFVVAKRAHEHREVFARIRSHHAVGDHSLDHDYTKFFSNVAGIRAWIEQSQASLRELGVRPVGYRPPAGVCTPPMLEALDQLHLPLILWSKRFYDSTITWTERRMRSALPRLKSGDVILLHDRQGARSRATFLATLELFLNEATSKGWSFLPLPGDLAPL